MVDGPIGFTLRELVAKGLELPLHKVRVIAPPIGGGFGGNITRILPEGLSVKINRTGWQVPPLFNLIQSHGTIKDDEMFQVFNMGIGMVAICDRDTADSIMAAVKDACLIGNVTRANGGERVIIS